MHRADFRVQLDRRKPPCVLDPSLVLAHAPGPSLALRLAGVLEPWLTRSFWQALDASELLLMHGDGGCGVVNATALSRWLALREGTELGEWVLRWIGDCLPESKLLDAVESDVIERYESLAEGLQRRAEEAGVHEGGPADWRSFDARRGACDALALSAVLEGALVLCAAPDDALPPPVLAARRLGLRVESAEDLPGHSLFAAERQFLREALASAGLAVMLQALPPLAAVHVWIDDDTLAPLQPAEVDAESLPDPWSAARVWWYRL